MATPFRVLSNLNLHGNQIQNTLLKDVSVEILESAPSSPKLGQLYFDSIASELKIWNGTNWLPTGGASSSEPID